MRKVLSFMLTSLDGFYQGPEGEIDWHNVDEEFNEFAIEQLDSVGVLLFGRVTYEGMASYWPTPVALANDPVVANKMNQFPKLVFSKTLASADWQNTRLVKDNFVQEISQLKNEPGNVLLYYTSGAVHGSVHAHEPG